MSFDDIGKMPLTGLIITGDRDDIAPADQIQRHINRWQIDPVYEIIKGCDHFYANRLGSLKAVLANYLLTKQ